MKASEARLIYDKGGELDQTRLKSVYHQIEEYSKMRICTMSITDAPLNTEALINRLKEDGYKCVHVSDQRDGNYWQISW